MKVKFVPQNVEFEIEAGKSVMHLAQDHGLYIKSVCKGVPSCAECRVRVVEGDHNVLPPGSEELSLIGTGHFIDHRRLSCQLRCFGDITVDMSEQIAKEQGILVGRKRKSVLKDDRVEEAVARRSENVVDEESSSDMNADAAHQRPVHASRDPRDSRESRETRDTRPRGGQQTARGDHSRGGQQARGPGGAPRGENRGGDRNQQGGQSRGERGGPQQGGGDRSPKGARPPLADQSAQEAAVPGEGGGTSKRKRRRRGKGGGGGGGVSGGGSGVGTGAGGGENRGPSAGRSTGPSAGPSAAPSRPGSGPSRPGGGTPGGAP